MFLLPTAQVLPTAVNLHLQYRPGPCRLKRWLLELPRKCHLQRPQQRLTAQDALGSRANPMLYPPLQVLGGLCQRHSKLCAFQAGHGQDQPSPTLAPRTPKVPQAFPYKGYGRSTDSIALGTQKQPLASHRCCLLSVPLHPILNTQPALSSLPGVPDLAQKLPPWSQGAERRKNQRME